MLGLDFHLQRNLAKDDERGLVSPLADGSQAVFAFAVQPFHPWHTESATARDLARFRRVLPAGGSGSLLVAAVPAPAAPPPGAASRAGEPVAVAADQRRDGGGGGDGDVGEDGGATCALRQQSPSGGYRVSALRALRTNTAAGAASLVLLVVHLTNMRDVPTVVRFRDLFQTTPLVGAARATGNGGIDGCGGAVQYCGTARQGPCVAGDAVVVTLPPAGLAIVFAKPRIP